jgi:Uma2 family endonuclease
MTAIAAGISFEQFLADTTLDPHSEWVDGTVVPMAAVADRHAMLVSWLYGLLDTYARNLELGRVYGEPFVTKLGPDLPGRSPDLMFVAHDDLDRVKRMHLDGPPDLAIEIVSPGSHFRDYVEKLAEYEQAGIAEYWVIDPDEQASAFFNLGQDGRYRRAKLDDGWHTCRVIPGIRLHEPWLWQSPLPKTLPILRDWGLV